MFVAWIPMFVCSNHHVCWWNPIISPWYMTNQYLRWEIPLYSMIKQLYIYIYSLHQHTLSPVIHRIPWNITQPIHSETFFSHVPRRPCRPSLRTRSQSWHGGAMADPLDIYIYIYNIHIYRERERVMFVYLNIHTILRIKWISSQKLNFSVDTTYIKYLGLNQETRWWTCFQKRKKT